MKKSKSIVTKYDKNTPYEKCIEECIGKAIQIAKGGGVDG